MVVCWLAHIGSFLKWGGESLASCRAGLHPVSHAQNKTHMRIRFKSTATVLALCLVFQVQADTLLGKVISVVDGYRPLLLELTKMVNAEIRASRELVNSSR